MPDPQSEKGLNPLSERASAATERADSEPATSWLRPSATNPSLWRRCPRALS
jgi:hypothetical protein